MPDLSDFFDEEFGVRKRAADGTLQEFFDSSIASGISPGGARFDPNAAPNNLERALAGFIQDKPTLQSVLGAAGLPGSAISNLLQGNFESAARNVGQFGADVVDAVLPGDLLPNDITRQDDRASFKDVLTNTLGIKGNLGEFDLPLIGRVTGKGALGLAGDIALDPLRFVNPLGLTAKGAAAAKQGTLAAAKFLPAAARTGAKVLRNSDLGAQAAIGQRALLAARFPFKEGATTIIKGQKVLDTIGRARMAFGGSFLGRTFSTTGRFAGIGRRSREAGLTARAEVTGPISNLYHSVREAIEDRVIKSGGSFDDVKTKVRDVIEKRSKPGDIVPQLSHAEDVRITKEIGALRADLNKRIGSVGQITDDEARRAFDFMAENTELLDDPSGVFTAVMASRTNRVFDEILTAEQRVGVDIGALDDATMNYMFRSVTPEAGKIIAENNLKNVLFSRIQGFYKSASSKARNAAFEGRQIAQINKWWKSQPFAKGTRLFEEDLDSIVRNRLRQTAGHADTAGALTKASELFSVESSPARIEANYIPVDGMFKNAGLPQSKVSALAGRVIPPEIARELEGVVRVFRDPKTPSAVLGVIDTAMNVMKTGTTSIFPQFHARNAISNVWANFLAGVKNPRRYIESSEIMADIRRIAKAGGDGKTWKFGERVVTTRELSEEMRQHRVLGFGQLSAEELGRTALKRAGESRARTAATFPFRYGRAFGERVENHAKIAHYIDKLEKGFNAESAASSVKKYLFDYGDLTVFEKNVMKRVVPFYTFWRKNTPLQLESILMKPGKVSGVAHFQRALQANRDNESGLNTTFVPEWTRRRLFGTNRDKDGSLRTMSGLGIGLEELAFFDKPVTEFLAMLRPEVKAAVQAATDRDIFRDIPLSKSDRAPSVLRFAEFVPGGKSFLNWMDFKAVDESKGRYRANPQILNWVNSGMGGISRALNTVANIDAATSPEAADGQLPANLLRLGIGFREDRLSIDEQQRRSMWAMVKLYEQYLEEQVNQGNVRKIDVFSVRKDTLRPADAETLRIKALMRDLRKTRKVAIELGANVQSTRQAAFRGSGGR